MEKIIVAMVTAPGEEAARRLAIVLVEERLAACVTMLPVHSIYRWKGAVEDQKEVMMVIKTPEGRLDAMTERVRELHPYEVPEIIALPVVGGNSDYLRWVAESTVG